MIAISVDNVINVYNAVFVKIVARARIVRIVETVCSALTVMV